MQWALAYSAGAWALLQVLAHLSDTYAWPPVILRVATALAGVGFLAVLVLSWYHGEQGQQNVSRAELALLGVVLAIAGATVVLVGGRPSPGSSPSGERAAQPAPASSAAGVEAISIAVLPFENRSSDPEQEYFSDGVTEEILNTLARMDGLRVASRTASFQFKRRPADIREIARLLGVTHVLEGSVQRAGDRLRITAQLVEAAAGYPVWSERYDREVKDVFAVREEIAGTIADALQIQLRPDPARAPAARRPTRSVEAYDLYLRAKFHAQFLNDSELDEAIRHLERAVRLDPAFALGHAELAVTYMRKAFALDASRVWEEKAFVATEKALALDPNLAAAHLARARVLWTPTRRFPHALAIRELQRAIELDPKLSTAYITLAATYNHVGLLDESLALSRQAADLDPTHPSTNVQVGQALLFAGRYAEALTVLQSIPAKANPGVPYQVGWALYGLGRRREARAFVDEAKRREGDQGGMLTSMQAILWAAEGRFAEAEAAIQRARQWEGKGYGHFHHTAYNIGAAYALLGNADRAVEWLRSAAQDGLPCFPLFAGDPNLQRLHADPHFTALLAELRRERDRLRTLVASGSGGATR